MNRLAVFDGLANELSKCEIESLSFLEELFSVCFSIPLQPAARNVMSTSKF